MGVRSGLGTERGSFWARRRSCWRAWAKAWMRRRVSREWWKEEGGRMKDEEWEEAHGVDGMDRMDEMDGMDGSDGVDKRES